MSEQELIRSAQKKDKAAFAELFRSHYLFLYHYLLKLTLSRETAEDVLQDTMLKAYLHMEIYDGSSAFSSWLVTIAGRTYLDRVRKEKREKAWLEGRRQAERRRLAWQLGAKNERWSDILEHFSLLKPDVRMAVLLKHYYGYTYDEIAKITGVKSGTIKSRVHTGIQELRKRGRTDD